MEEVLNLIIICPTDHIQNLNQHEIFLRFCESFKWYFWQK